MIEIKNKKTNFFISDQIKALIGKFFNLLNLFLSFRTRFKIFPIIRLCNQFRVTFYNTSRKFRFLKFPVSKAWRSLTSFPFTSAFLILELRSFGNFASWNLLSLGQVVHFAIAVIHYTLTCSGSFTFV